MFNTRAEKMMDIYEWRWTRRPPDTERAEGEARRSYEPRLHCFNPPIASKLKRYNERSATRHLSLSMTAFSDKCSQKPVKQSRQNETK